MLLHVVLVRLIIIKNKIINGNKCNEKMTVSKNQRALVSQVETEKTKQTLSRVYVFIKYIQYIIYIYTYIQYCHLHTIYPNKINVN